VLLATLQRILTPRGVRIAMGGPGEDRPGTEPSSQASGAGLRGTRPLT